MAVCAYDQERLAAWFGSGSDWLQLVSRCGVVYIARTPRAMSASLPRVLPTVGRDRHLSLRADPRGLALGRRARRCWFVRIGRDGSESSGDWLGERVYLV